MDFNKLQEDFITQASSIKETATSEFNTRTKDFKEDRAPKTPETISSKDILQYFNPLSMQPAPLKSMYFMIGAGVLMLLIDIFPKMLAIFMILCGAVALAMIKFSERARLTDSEYDNYVMQQMGMPSMKNEALNKLGIDESEVEEIEPIILSGYVYQGADNIKQGRDGQWRSNKFEVFSLFFTVNELHCYTKRITATGGKKMESTDVYFYKDIVSASTTYETFTRPQQGTIPAINVDYECFKLTTSAGTSITVSLRDVDGIQKSINAMRALLKEKKSQ